MTPCQTDVAIECLKKGISANNVAIDAYKSSIVITEKYQKDDDAYTIMEMNAIVMLEDGNNQMAKAIEILRNYTDNKN